MKLLKAILKAGFLLASIGVLTIIVLIVALRRDHSTETDLPIPTGPFAVGRTMYTWVDETSPDKFAPIPDSKRELIAWIWYPSTYSPAATIGSYLPAQWREAYEREPATLFSAILNRDLSKVHSHSMSDTEISQDQSTYPVVILRAGLSAMTIEYSTLAEDLASHGYVVAGFDAPYRTRFFVRSNGTVIRRAPENDPEAPGNKEVQGDLITKLLYAWSADTGFIVDQLERLNTSDPNSKFFGRLDMNKIGVLGHSLGGATSLQFCHDDARCKAGIDIDGAPYGSVTKDGVKQPFMFLLSDHGDASDAESVQIDSNIRSIYDRLPPHGRLRITVRGSNHFNFADGAVTKNQILMAIFHKLGLIEMDGQRQLNITSYCVLSFFERYLRVGGDAGLEIRSPAFSEIEFDE